MSLHQRLDASNMASIKLNALEIGSLQVSEGNRKLRSGIDSRAAVTVSPKTVAEDYPVRKTSGKAKSYRPVSGKFLPDLGARKAQVRLQDRSFRCVNQRVAMAVSEMNEMGHDVFFPRSDRGVKAYAYHEGSGTKLVLERVSGVFELPVELVPYKRTTSKSNNTSAYFSLSALEQIGNLMDKIAKTEHPK